jgi:hypothetical protein
MTDLQRAECLFDEAERLTLAAKAAVRNHREADASRHFQRVRECRHQAHSILDRMVHHSAPARIAS